MSFFIEDGTGTGKKAKVNSQNELKVSSVSRTEIEEHTHEEKSWALCRGGNTSVTTTASYSALIYFKAPDHSHISRMHIASDIDNVLVQIMKNPTAGTIVSDAVAGTAENKHFGNVSNFPGTVYAGSNGKTFTDGSVIHTFIVGKGTTYILDFPNVFALDTDNTIGVQVKPPSTADIALGIETIINPSRA